MSYLYSFEKLEVWQNAQTFVVLVYDITSKFPDEEKYGLVSQMRRASVSEIEFQEMNILLKEITNKLNALKNSQQKRLNEQQINR
jgi:hypothetical protein